MREHKFKAWDKTNNEWYMNGDVFSLEYSGGYGDFYFDNDHPRDMRKVELEWVQWTGLKAKNGDIYKGDILQKIDRDGDSYSGSLWKVVWVECTARFAIVAIDTEKYGPAEWTIDPAMYEIIGNKFQNPELLK